MATISASLIVKNEEAIMQRCLDSVSKWADEIVIVDTGSTDRTKEIAAAHPKVKLYDSEHFNKDTHYSDFRFNVAKNESISKCTKDWIVWWDADDFIDEAGADLIRHLADTTTDDCLFTFICSFGVLRFEHCRMFRSGRKIEFDPNHSCHEYLNSGGRLQVLRPDIIVQHLPGKKGVPSAVRNTAIMEKDYFERGFKDQRTMFYLANSYKEMGRHDDAVKMYNSYLKVSGWKEERYFATFYKAQIFSLIGNFPDAYKAIYQSLIEDDRFAESYCLMGDILLHNQQHTRARHWYEMALAMEIPADSRLFVSKNNYNEYPKERIGHINKKLGEQPKEVAVVPAKEGKKEGKQYKYRLPEDNTLAAAACAALAFIAKDGIWVTVIPNNPEQQRMVESHGIAVAEGKGMELVLPNNLRDKGEVEWYCRAAGFVKNGPFPEPIKMEAKNVA